jgi:DNA-directed RNA polymerase specialized sigma24 family protein
MSLLDSKTDHNQQESLQQLLRCSVRELADQLVTETKKFMARQPSDDRIGLALFTLAIQGNQEAWSYLYEQYAPLVLTWVTQHQSATPLLGQEGSAPLVNAAFAKFAQALTPEKMGNFDTLAAILKYLKMCVHSVVADEVRSRMAQQLEDPLDVITQEPASDDPAEHVVSHIAAQDLWQIIEEELHGEEERIVVYQAYVQGMRPGEICMMHRHYFPIVDDVYRVKRNVLERLRRNQRLRQEFAAMN